MKKNEVYFQSLSDWGNCICITFYTFEPNSIQEMRNLRDQSECICIVSQL